MLYLLLPMGTKVYQRWILHKLMKQRNREFCTFSRLLQRHFCKHPWRSHRIRTFQILAWSIQLKLGAIPKILKNISLRQQKKRGLGGQNWKVLERKYLFRKMDRIKYSDWSLLCKYTSHQKHDTSSIFIFLRDFFHPFSKGFIYYNSSLKLS